VGEMPLDTQAYLLRVLENGEYIRVGSSKVRKTDVRVIAATNVDLKEKVKSKKFREDLYYRLNTVPIYIPPLRERPEDIMLLFKKFARDFAEKYNSPTIKLDEEAEMLMKNYSWPGNIRELKNVVEKLSILSDDRIITAEKLLEIVPDIKNRNLPISLETEIPQNIQDRELIYKFLLDMKKDLTELKTLFYELITANNLRVPSLPGASIDTGKTSLFVNHFDRKLDDMETKLNIKYPPEYPHIVTPKPATENFEVEILDENLNLYEMEKNLIIKALKKHNGKRKKAASELGLSERTLYRKIKEYNITE